MAKRLPLYPDRPRPLWFAHRGLSSEAPENTMAAFRLARDHGIPGIELDIHLSADGKIVVIHDGNTARVAPGTNVHIEAAQWKDIAAVDVGSWKDKRYAGERPPLLSDVLEEFTPAMYVDIEIKAPKAADIGLEAALATLLASMGLGADCVAVSSFNPIALKRLKSLAPAIPTGTLYCSSPELPWYLRKGEGRWLSSSDFLKPEHVMVRRAGMSLKRAFGGRPVLTWTVDDADEAGRVLALGCDGVISNRPHMIQGNS